MRRFPPVLLMLLLVGCEGSGPPAAPVAEIRAGFPRGAVVDAIQVTAVDRLALRVAELVAPDGSTTPANNIDVVRDPQAIGGQRAAEATWTDAVTGNGAVATAVAPNPLANAALQSQVQVLTTFSTATIPLPDPVAYRRDWPKYRIRVTFGTAPNQLETREIPAPEPPPAT